jgi:hypothetical protein
VTPPGCFDELKAKIAADVQNVNTEILAVVYENYIFSANIIP